MIMLLYLEHAYEKWRTEGRMPTVNDLHEPIIDGTVKRMRPKVMTIMGILMGLLLIMWSDGAGADVMKRIVAPRIGGVSTSFLLELPVYSAIFYVWGVGKSGALVGQSKRIVNGRSREKGIRQGGIRLIRIFCISHLYPTCNRFAALASAGVSERMRRRR
jgi:hypothetical protein